MKKLIYILVIMILNVAAKYSYAQNLVPNPSFEIHSSCPNNASQMNLATPWYAPTAGTSDYFNSCDTGFANVPFHSGGNGYQYARTGNAFAGLYALDGFSNSYREYIQVQLISSLVHDSCYLVEFYCNLANGSWYSMNRLGAYISDTAIHLTGAGSTTILTYTPQIVSNAFLTDTLNWMHISGYYHAIGGEKFITIGDFKSFNAGDTLMNPGGSGSGMGFASAYYLIDDVSITKIAECDTTLGIHDNRNSNLLFRLFPNPASNQITIEFENQSPQNFLIEIQNTLGQTLYSETIKNAIGRQSKNIDASAFSNGIYFVRLRNEKESVSKKFIKN
jgi:hypothetical protein